MAEICIFPRPDVLFKSFIFHSLITLVMNEHLALLPNLLFNSLTKAFSPIPRTTKCKALAWQKLASRMKLRQL